MNEKAVRLVSDYGIGNAQAIVQASEEGNRPTLARCLALVENESGGRNVFGADPRGDALPRAWFDSEVTQFRYTIYKVRRNAGMTPNGVGPCQLTSAGLQKDAEKDGGCWKPFHNCRIGFGFLHQLILAHGSPEAGAAAYNGSGPAAVAYGQRFAERAAIWEVRLRVL